MHGMGYMNKKRLTIVVISTIIIIMLYTTAFPQKQMQGLSDYKLLSTSEYKLVDEKREVIGIHTIENDNDLIVQSFENNPNEVLLTSENQAIGIYKDMISKNLLGVLYFPVNNIIYYFGKEKPVNIIIGAPATASGDSYESPLYIGYYDGTCEYPAEFDYVRSKKKCSQYLQDTLDFVGYDTVDEMLEDVFGGYLTKDDNAKD